MCASFSQTRSRCHTHRSHLLNNKDIIPVSLLLHPNRTKHLPE
uniref:Glycogen synthase kinase-3 MsK-1 family protein n=1 Tax=Rhizophora mucronata TaxID=61149 RepID=A0A2P2LLG6_RHIMU